MKAQYAIVAAFLTSVTAACKSTDDGGAARAPATDPRPSKVDAQQAMAAAIAAVPGSAQEVKLESRAGKSAYEVTVIPSAGGAPVRVEVDATTGQVANSTGATEAGHEGDDDDD